MNLVQEIAPICCASAASRPLHGLWRVNLAERRATIWMRTVSRRDHHARQLIVARQFYATGGVSPG